MSVELVEVVEVLDHPPERLWTIVNDLESYSRFAREISWAYRTSHAETGVGSQYEVRFSVERGRMSRYDVDVLVHRPPEHLVLVSDRWPGGHVSIRLTPVEPGRTELHIAISLPLGSRLPASWLRKRVRKAVALVDDHLAGRSQTTSPRSLDQTATAQSQLGVMKILTKAGIVLPGRPDLVARQLKALSRWGATMAGGYGAATARAPRADAIRDELGALTFADIAVRTDRLANALTEYGVRQGRRVALMCRNHGAMVESMIACGKLGASVVLLNTGLSADQVMDTVRSHRPAAILADDEYFPLLRDLPAALPRIRTWGEAAPTVDGLIETGSPRKRKPPTAPGKIIVLTSGTTSNPKGARRRNPHGLRTAAAIISRIPLESGERMLIAAPLFHTWGLAVLQLGMGLTATTVLPRRFDAEETLRLIEENRCTSLFVVPIMLQRIMDLPKAVRRNYDTSSLRVVASSGAPLSANLVVSFMDEFGDVLYNLYGSTEVSYASIADPADLRAAPTTAGRCPIGTRIGILDGRGRPVPPGVDGQICVGNDMHFEGYVDGSSRMVYDNMMATGDRGYLDADGRVFVSGRQDDMIISGGEKMFPRPVEELLLSMQQVRDAVVVGVPDREFGQRFAAYVVAKPGAVLNEAMVCDYVHAHLPRFAVPRDVVFVDQLPRNATGKVVRGRLAVEDLVSW
ncbi:MAG: AMP-binding protein [Actinophytocola sp.]|uniref:AMP-binding protein n=1 Tax=Actinophytocola sp. TaxID=1872138 RepID=UPI003D6C12D3